jgi:hypothetical protein
MEKQVYRFGKTGTESHGDPIGDIQKGKGFDFEKY